MNVKLYITLIIVLVSFFQVYSQGFNIGISTHKLNRENAEKQTNYGLINDDALSSEDRVIRAWDYNLFVELIHKKTVFSLSFRNEKYSYKNVLTIFDEDMYHVNDFSSGYNEVGVAVSFGYIDTIERFIFKGLLGPSFDLLRYSETSYSISDFYSNGALDYTTRKYYTNPNVKKYGISQEIYMGRLFFNNRLSAGIVLKNRAFYGITKGEYEYAEDIIQQSGNVTRINTNNITVKDQSFRFANFTYGLQLVYNIYNLK